MFTPNGHSRDNELALDKNNSSYQNDMGNSLEVILQRQNMTVDDYFESISNRTMSARAQTTTVPTDIRYVKEGITWGVVMPLSLVGLFLLVLASCLYWQSWKEKRRMRQFLAQQRQIVDLPRDGPAGIRLSTRSTASQRSRGSSTNERVAVGPLVTLQRHGSKMFSRQDEERRTIGTLPRKLSPINEVTHRITDMVQDKSRRSIFIDHGHPSPWATPSASGGNHEFGMKGYENPCFSAPGKLTGNVYCEECDALNSPYFPHNNTPMTEYDMDSDKSELLSNMEPAAASEPSAPVDLVRHMFPHVLNPAPSLDGEEISSITTFPENSHRMHLVGDNPQGASVSTSISDSLSLPSSISRFHASRNNNTPIYPLASTRNSSPLRLNFTVSSSVEMSDHFSDNTSMIPCVGSSCTSSLCTQAISRTNLYSSLSSNELSQNPYDKTRSASAPESRRESFVVAPHYKACSVEVDLFRSVSVCPSSNTNSNPSNHDSPSAQEVGHRRQMPVPVASSGKADMKGQIVDENHNVYYVDAMATKRVKFSMPLLDKKQYWV